MKVDHQLGVMDTIGRCKAALLPETGSGPVTHPEQAGFGEMAGPRQRAGPRHWIVVLGCFCRHWCLGEALPPSLSLFPIC